MLATEKAGARPGNHATALLAEADRLMTVCNSCRYCEGLCAVFPAMEMRRAFPDGDLNYLANLCHSAAAPATSTASSRRRTSSTSTCRACWRRCAASPTRPTRGRARWRRCSRATGWRSASWRRCASRRSFSALPPGTIRRVLFGTHTGPGAFYKLMPHNAMALLFGLAFLYAIVALALGLRAFWRDIGDPVRLTPGASWQAMRDAATLRYLDGGGIGCYNHDERPNDRRAFYHHLTFYGFVLCFASTCVATLYHYLLGRDGAVSLVGPAGGARHGRRHRADVRPARA